jgi:hypothetical protein
MADQRIVLCHNEETANCPMRATPTRDAVLFGERLLRSSGRSWFWRSSRCAHSLAAQANVAHEHFDWNTTEGSSGLRFRRGVSPIVC